jgi:hypothetical protein
MNVLTNDTAVGRGIRATFHGLVGFTTGLIYVVWKVEGVPEAVYAYLQNNLLGLALAIGLGTGASGFIVNALRKDVKTK